MNRYEFQRAKRSYEAALRDLRNALRAHEMIGSERTAAALELAMAVKDAARDRYHELLREMQEQSFAQIGEEL